MPRVMRSITWSFVVAILLAAAIAFTGCGKKRKDDKTTVPDAGENLVHELPETDSVPPDEPVWTDGTTFNRVTMMGTIRARTPALHELYAKMKEEFPELKGQVTLHFIVHPDGSVSDVEIRESKWNDLVGDALADSIAEHVKNWTFPPGAKKDIGVTQPWTFEP